MEVNMRRLLFLFQVIVFMGLGMLGSFSDVDSLKINYTLNSSMVGFFTLNSSMVGFCTLNTSEG